MTCAAGSTHLGGWAHGIYWTSVVVWVEIIVRGFLGCGWSASRASDCQQGNDVVVVGSVIESVFIGSVGHAVSFNGGGEGRRP